MEDCNKYNDCIGCPSLKEMKINGEKISVCELAGTPMETESLPNKDDIILYDIDDLYSMPD
jgi:hypothetical protein